jgi:hypothetical protein
MAEKLQRFAFMNTHPSQFAAALQAAGRGERHQPRPLAGAILRQPFRLRFLWRPTFPVYLYIKPLFTDLPPHRQNLRTSAKSADHQTIVVVFVFVFVIVIVIDPTLPGALVSRTIAITITVALALH